MISKNYIIFGGAGFIGSHFARYLLDKNIVDVVVIADITGRCDTRFEYFLTPYLKCNRVIFKTCDVRKDIKEYLGIQKNVVGIANFAAIHREPGHSPNDYYETNLNGAINVCAYAELIECFNIVFTSSIAPYGPTEHPKDEDSLPVPETPYGGSKLASEKIHQIWAAKASHRRLTIVRPGVVFGPGECGNVTRMIKAIRSGYFVFISNHKTRKAGIYIKELCNAIWWSVSLQNRPSFILMNLTMNPGPSVEEYVETIKSVSNTNRMIFNFPLFVILPISIIVDFLANLIKADQPINPIRIKKLVRSNNIIPAFLNKNNYPWCYTLESAFVDWLSEAPEDWN